MESYTLDRAIQYVGCLLLLVLIMANRPCLLGQSPGYQPGQPYLRPPGGGYSGPPLSTALPSYGPFSAGIHMQTPATTGTPVGSGGASMLPQRPTFPNVVQNTATLPGNGSYRRL